MPLLRSLRDAGIGTKALVAPGIVIVLMLTTGFIASRSARQQEQELAEFGRVMLPRTADIYRALDLAARAHTDLFRTVSWAANSDDPAKVAENTARVRAGLGLLHAFLDGLAAQWEADLFDSARSAVQSYQAAAANVLTMAAEDPATSFALMFLAERRFEDLQAELAELRDRQAARSSARMEAALGAERRARTGFLALLAAAVVAAAAATALITQLTSRPIRRMAQAMTALAAGELRVAIPGLGRRDEVGQMASAVEVFRDMLAVSQRLSRERDATREHSVRRSAHIEALSGAFNAAMGDLVGSLSSAAEEMRGTAQSMSTVASRTGERSVAVATAAREAEQGVTTIAAATPGSCRDRLPISGSRSRGRR